MRRWSYDDEDENVERFFDNDDEDDEQYISEEEYQELVGKAGEMQEAQLQLAAKDVNHRLLADTISMLKFSWIWPFKSTKARLKEIGRAYRYFLRLTDEDKKKV